MFRRSKRKTDEAYTEAMRWLDELEWFGVRMRLEVMERLLGEMGDFHKDVACVHVAGTNGKGSVTAFVAAALAEAGHKTGAYTSPHLVRFEERMRVNGEPIPREKLVERIREIQPVVEKVSAELGPVTYFEASTLLALRHFQQENCHVAVLEAGLGGRLDATNVYEEPLVTTVTNVSLEHTRVLGDTLEAIAKEKAAILKPGVPAVTGAGGAALDVIEEEADLQVAPLRVLGRDFDAEVVDATPEGQTLRFTGARRDYGDVHLPFPGAHQAKNAALAVATLEAVDEQGLEVPVEAVRTGLPKAAIRGRLQWLPTKPRMLLDGAHNPAAMKSLVQFLREHDLRPVVLFGALQDKNVNEMVYEIGPMSAAAVVTRPPTDRALHPREAAREFSRTGAVSTVVESVPHALDTAMGQAGEDNVVVVCGSLYLVGEILRMYEGLPAQGA